MPTRPGGPRRGGGRGPKTLYPDPPVVVGVELTTPTAANIAPAGQFVIAGRVISASVPAPGGGDSELAIRTLADRVVTFSTSDATKATVTASATTDDFGTWSATITGQADGSATIIPRCEGVNGPSVVVTVTSPVNAVASVVLSSDTAAILVGGTTHVQASVRDSGDNVLSDKTVTWTKVSNPTFITLSADSGDESHDVTVTGAIAGTATFKATCEGVDSSVCTVTVSAAPPGGAEFTDDFDNGTLAGSQNGNAWGATNAGPGDGVAVVADAGASAGYALGFTFFGEASTAADAWAEKRFSVDDYTEITVEAEFYTPANYVHRQPVAPAPTAANNKLLRLWDEDNSSAVVHVGASLLPAADGASLLNGEYVKYGSSGMSSAGPWVKVFRPDTVDVIRFYYKVPTGVNVADGIIRLWVNGTQVLNNTAVNFRRTSAVPGSGALFRNGYLMGWANSGFTATTTINVRRFTIWNGLETP